MTTTIAEMLKYADATIHGGNPSDPAIIDAWAAAGFDNGDQCVPWWDAGCFNADRAAELRGRMVVPEAVAGPVAGGEYHGLRGRLIDGYSLGYWHANGDLSTDDTVDACRADWSQCDTLAAVRRLAAAVQIGRRIGQAIARDVVADDLPRDWTGLDPQDADELTAGDYEPDTPEWAAAEEEARRFYAATLASLDAKK